MDQVRVLDHGRGVCGRRDPRRDVFHPSAPGPGDWLRSPLPRGRGRGRGAQGRRQRQGCRREPRRHPGDRVRLRWCRPGSRCWPTSRCSPIMWRPISRSAPAVRCSAPACSWRWSGWGISIGMTVGIAMLVGLVLSVRGAAADPHHRDIRGGTGRSPMSSTGRVHPRGAVHRGWGRSRWVRCWTLLKISAPDPQRHPGSADVRTRPPPGSAGRHYPARHPVPHRRGHYRGDAAADRCAAVGVQSRHRAAGQLGRDHRGQRGFRLLHRSGDRRSVRLHGRPHRLVQQPDLRWWGS